MADPIIPVKAGASVPRINLAKGVLVRFQHTPPTQKRWAWIITSGDLKPLKICLFMWSLGSNVKEVKGQDRITMMGYAKGEVLR